MITISKTNDFKSPYEAPRCKAFSISAESRILTGSDDTGHAGGDQDYNDQGGF